MRHSSDGPLTSARGTLVVALSVTNGSCSPPLGSSIGAVMPSFRLRMCVGLALCAVLAGCSSSHKQSPAQASASAALASTKAIEYLTCQHAGVAEHFALAGDINGAGANYQEAAKSALQIPLGSDMPDLHNAGVGADKTNTPEQITAAIGDFLQACSEYGVPTS
ncbi:MAG TPA: hypothetical protein VK662_05950 [Acidothermaceae bacterium]|jgi:hypothetical protein|nr:hypothetical protein [Acidothermaceae bacterium]